MGKEWKYFVWFETHLTDHKQHVARLEKQLEDQSDSITGLEKTVKTLENERAVLSATVEARETKLGRMAELQTSFDELSVKATENGILQSKLADSESRCTALSNKIAELEKDVAASKEQSEEEGQRRKALEEALEASKKSTDTFRAELEAQQMAIQKLKAERNSYKQKGDSLAKEVAKVCRNGKTIREVEQIVADDAARRHEVGVLREQKRKALEELEHYRTAHEQSRAAQKLAGVDQDQARILERNAELERLLSSLTEYVSAKEMQLDTLKQVNEALQLEIGNLSKATMSRNLGDHDI